MDIPKPQPKRLNSYNTKITNEWGTPPELYTQLNNEFSFTFDPCPLGGTVDGLTIDWGTSNFVNCPYSNVEAWAKKCRGEQLKGNLSVLLIPSRTSTHYFHDWILPFAEVRFIKGRLKFLNQEGKQTQCAPFASLLAIFRP
jgi:site-specific DNA-methyltransferase (adenine-specific)